MTKLKFLSELSNKAKEIYSHIQSNPQETLRYLFLFLGGILVLYLFGALVDVAMLAWTDRRQRKSGVTLKIYPRESNSIKETEALLKHIHGVLLTTKWRKYVYGRPYMSFEIFAEKDKIGFYIWVPRGYKDMLMERLYATYSEISIVEHTEELLPKKLHRKQSVYGTELSLGYHHMLKIRTKADRDILASILSNMKGIEWHEKAVLQVLIRPLDHDWQLKGREILENYEINNKRPLKRAAFTQFLSKLKDEFGEELAEVTENKPKEKKTRSDRRDIRVISEKLVESGFEVCIRVMAYGIYRKMNNVRVKAISAGFSELDADNRFTRNIIFNKKRFYKRVRSRHMYVLDRNNIFTTSELASFMLRLPAAELLETMEEIEKPVIKELPPPQGIEKEKNIIGINHYRGKETPIGIKDVDLKRQGVVQGAIGSGKSEWLKTFLIPHLALGRGALVIEPHGKLSDELLEIIPPERVKDVIWFDLFDDYPPPFNFCKILKRPGHSFEDQAEKTVEEIIDIFSTKFSDTWTGRNEHYFTNALKTLIELQDGSIIDIKRLFYDAEFRKYAMTKVKDPEVLDFWKNQFKVDARGKMDRETESTVLSLMHKLGKFLNSKKIMRAVGQEDCIDFLDILNNNKIAIFRFAKDNMSEYRIKFLGSIAIKLILVAAFQRDKKMWDVPFIVAIDEAQNFLTPNIKTFIYELRKYGVSLWPMHQGLEQLDELKGLKEAIYGNVGTIITLMTGKDDAKFFETVHEPRVNARDISNLASRYGYVRTLVDGVKTQAFNIYTLDSPQSDKEAGPENVYTIKKLNQDQRKHRKDIDKYLQKRMGEYKNIEEDEEDYKVALDEDDTYEENNDFEIDVDIQDANDEVEIEYHYYDGPEIKTKGEAAAGVEELQDSDGFDFDIEIRPEDLWGEDFGEQEEGPVEEIHQKRVPSNTPVAVDDEEPVPAAAIANSEKKPLTLGDLTSAGHGGVRDEYPGAAVKDADKKSGEELWEKFSRIEKQQKRARNKVEVDPEREKIQKEGLELWEKFSKLEKQGMSGNGD